MSEKIKYGLLGLLLIPCWVIAARYDIDLVVLHHAAKLVHQDPTTVYTDTGSLGRYFYGPVSLVFIYPLGALPYVVVKWFWILLQTLSYVVFWRALTRLYPKLQTPTAFWAWIGVWLVTINPIHNNFQSNNIQLMLMAVLVIAELLSQSKQWQRQVLAGVLCSLTAAIKVFPLFIVLYYFVQRSNPVRLGLLLGGLVSILSPLVFFGWSDGTFLFQDFFSALTSYKADNSLTRTPDILCLPSWFARTFGESPLASLSLKGTIAFMSLIFYLTAWRNRTHLSREEKIDWWAFALALMAFLNPSTRPHYFIFYVPAFCSVLERSLGWERKQKLWSTVGISILLIAFTAEGVVGKSLNNWLEANSFPTYGMAIILLCIIWILKKQPLKQAH